MLEKATRVFDGTLVAFGTWWAYTTLTFENLLMSIVERPIESMVGLSVIFLSVTRAARVMQKMRMTKKSKKKYV